MSPWRNKFATLLAVVSFVLGFGACEVACAAGDDHSAPTKAAQHHCIAHCACHGAIVASTSATESAPTAEAGESVFASVRDDWRLVPASIFHPPRA